MNHYGLLGKTLVHSFSQCYFTEKFAQEHISADYTLREVPEKEQLAQVLAQDWAGLNITIPYKQDVIPLLDELDDAAQRVGAVNTIKFTTRNGQRHLVGYNTDIIGFEQSLRPLLSSCSVSALIFGTGGASKAVIFVLNKLGITWQQVSRTKSGNRITYEELTPDIIASHKLLINTTPLGTYPNINDCVPIDYTAITCEHLLYDLVYNPEVTEFLRRGQVQGAKIKNGYEMLRLQAEASYKIWNEN